MRSSDFAPFVLVLALGACGGKAGDTAPASANPASAEAPVLFPASKDGSYFIVAAHPDTGNVSAFGPALPVDATKMDWSGGAVHVSSDGKRVAAVFAPKSASANGAEEVLVVGDGSTWTTIDHAAHIQLADASDDLSLLSVEHACANPSGGMFPLVLRADGTILFQDDTCAPGGSATVSALAPDGSYAVVRGGGQIAELTIHRADGQQATLSHDGEVVVRAFATSLIIGQGEGGAHWLDTSGNAIDVAGWPAPSNMQVGAQLLVDRGVIYALRDRAIERVADLPPGIQPAQVADVRGSFVVTTAQMNQSQVVDATGAVVATYAPSPPSSAPPASPSGSPTINLEQWTVSRSKSDAWNLFFTQYDTMTTTDAVTYESADDLWLFVDRNGAAVSRTIELRRAPVAPGQSDVDGRGRAYTASSTGQFVLYVDSGMLHALDVDSGADRALATDFSINPVGGSIQRHGGSGP